MRRVAVLVSGGGTNLQALIDAKSTEKMPHAKLVLVVSSKPDVQALRRAECAGIPALVVARKNFENPCDFDAALLAVLQKHRIEVVVLAGFLSVVGPALLAAFPQRIINVHPSLLPSFGGVGFYGLAVHEAALARGVKVSGATVHLVNDEVDGGAILMQKAVDVLPGDTPSSLQKRIMENAEWELLPLALERLCCDMSGDI